MANDIAMLVDDISVFVYGSADQLLWITFSQDTNLVLVFIFDPSIWYYYQTFKTGEWSFFITFLLR